MEWFTVKYRQPNGAITEAEFEAADKSALFKLLAEKKISAINIQPGRLSKKSGSRSAAKRATHSSSTGLVHGIIAGIFVVIIAVVVLCVIHSEPSVNEEKNDRKSKVVKDVAPKMIPKPQAVEEKVVVKRKPTPEEQKKLRPGDEGFDPAAHPFVLVYTNKPSEEVGSPIARNGVEQVLYWIFSTPIGDAPLMCPDIPVSELADIEKILDKGSDFHYEDDEAAREGKQIIDLAKKELKHFIENGGEPQEFFKYYHHQLIAYHEQFMDAQSAVLKLAKEDPLLAADYYRKVNEKLAKQGIKQIKLSNKMKERLGITEE